MDNIVVDPSSGDVGVSSMIKCANPEAHPGSILRSVNGVLKDVTSVPAMTKRSIKQKSIVVADLALHPGQPARQEVGFVAARIRGVFQAISR